uniref:Cytochrome P450, family 4, subfamily T, polypeptide 8 n=1 Tax=Scleropages formosus TaxID=113540 RepID=A0A8C9SZJ1_SCLFO
MACQKARAASGSVEVFAQSADDSAMDLLERLRSDSLSLPPLAFCLSLCALLVAALKVTKLVAAQRKTVRLLRSFPGPPAHWLLGHIAEFSQDGTEIDRVYEWAQKFPFVFPLWFGPFVAVLLMHHPDYIKTITTSTEPKDDFVYKFLIPWIGKDGLLVSRGQKWFRHRRLLTPGFHYDILKNYVPLMADSTNIMLDKWETYANQEDSFELFEHVSLMALDTIMKCAFSCESHCQTEGGTNSYIQAVYELSDIINTRSLVFPYHSDVLFHLSPHGYRFRKACKIAHQHTDEVIKQRKKALKEELGTGQKRYLDFLDILLCAKDDEQQGLSDKDIRAEVDTFMFEGHDTTATGISWILYSLACHPKHQQMCREEVTEVLRGKDTMEWEDLSKIPYTTMCIKESLRLYPPVPSMARKLTKAVTFADGRTLPEGSMIGTSIYSLHRNPAIWENPEVPTARYHCHTFRSDSDHDRNCIGQNFAMNEMKVAVALTLRRYQLEKDPKKIPKKIPRLVLRSLNGIHLKIRRVQPEP